MARDRRTQLVLLAQSHQDSHWNKPFVALRDKLCAEFGEDRVMLAYINQAPTLLDVAEHSGQGAGFDLIVLPLLLQLDASLEKAIPRLVVQVKAEYPDLGVILLPPVGEHPLIMEAVHVVARSALAT